MQSYGHITNRVEVLINIQNNHANSNKVKWGEMLWSWNSVVDKPVRPGEIPSDFFGKKPFSDEHNLYYKKCDMRFACVWNRRSMKICRCYCLLIVYWYILNNNSSQALVSLANGC